MGEARPFLVNVINANDTPNAGERHADPPQWLVPDDWYLSDYLPRGSSREWTDPHYALLCTLWACGPLPWRTIVMLLGPETASDFAEIRLRRARHRVRLTKHWIAAGVCEWWLPDVRPNPAAVNATSDHQGIRPQETPEQTEHPEPAEQP
jgi:hypothetical protein